MKGIKIKQRWVIRFCYGLGHTATETFAKLQQAYRDSVLLRVQVLIWLKRFAEGRESIDMKHAVEGRYLQELMKTSTQFMTLCVQIVS